MSTATYNRIYSTMFEGSLWGSGPLKIACWAYVLAEMRPDFGKSEFYVELNPDKVAAAIGVGRNEVVAVVGEFCGPDEQSRTGKQDGARLEKQGQFSYLVVNGSFYNDIKRREIRREQNRQAQQKRRKAGKTVVVKEDNEPQFHTNDKLAKLKAKPAPEEFLPVQESDDAPF